MKTGIGLKCPNGHFRVQIIVGNLDCPKCGSQLVADSEAADTALNRHCKHCNTMVSLNVTDTGNCPKCGKSW